MRYFKSVSFLFCFFTALVGQANAGQPTITIEYNQNFDSVCSFFRGGTIKEEWKAELVLRQREFEDLWKSVAPKMIEAREQITKKPFPDKHFNARLTLCDLPSQSLLGIGINMRYALKSFTQTPVPMRYKVNTLFHELLHKFLAEYPVKDSLLLKQHNSESERTKDHLHLFALQKAVFIKLNETDALKEQINIDSQLPAGDYKRAWEIINTTDDEYLKYIAEISQ